MAKIRARYIVKGPRKEAVTYTKCTIDPETKSLQQQEVTEKMDCWMVYFPQGHSIRVTSFEKLKELGYHLKPRMVDMETGDVIDTGGDPYDFDNNPHEQYETVLVDEDEEEAPPSKKVKENT